MEEFNLEANHLPKNPPSSANPPLRDRQAEELYSAYPRKAGKPAALRAIKTALKKVPFDQLKSHVERYAEWCKSSGQELQFTPHPATWFNQERWNDQLSTATAPRLNQNAQMVLEHLKARIRNSPAFPGGPRYVDYTTPETKAQLKSDIEELERLCPGFELRTLR